MFWSDEEKKEKSVVDLTEEEIDERLKKVIITPESKSEYEKRVKYETRIIEGGGRVKGVLIYKNDEDFKFWISLEKKRKLVEEGIEAIVDANYTFSNSKNYFHEAYFGLPVSRKKGNLV